MHMTDSSDSESRSLSGSLSLGMAYNLPESRPVPQEPAITERELRYRLEQMNRLTSRLAHDLRGPLHLVSGYADLLGMEQIGPLNAKQKQFVELIKTGALGIEDEIDRCQKRLVALIQPGTETS